MGILYLPFLNADIEFEVVASLLANAVILKFFHLSVHDCFGVIFGSYKFIYIQLHEELVLILKLFC